MPIEKLRFLYEHKIDLSRDLSIDQIQGTIEDIDINTLVPLVIKNVDSEGSNTGGTDITGTLHDGNRLKLDYP